MKIIFLDIDGVISTEKSHYALDKDACDLLGKIIDATDAKIVISSSWRRNTVEDTKEELTTIRHSVPFPFPYADRIVGVTIRAYAYIMQGIHLSIHFVKTDTLLGLSEDDVEQAIKILNQ